MKIQTLIIDRVYVVHFNFSKKIDTLGLREGSLALFLGLGLLGCEGSARGFTSFLGLNLVVGCQYSFGLSEKHINTGFDC